MVSGKFNMQVLLQAEEKKRANGSTSSVDLIELLWLAKEIFYKDVNFILTF